MIVYGVALLGFCLLIGKIAGDLLGQWMGVQANVGGVGIAMLLLMLLCSQASQRFSLSSAASSGIGFWSAMYIPIVVAMAAKQNVIGALDGGAMALVAGVAAVAVSFALIPLLARVGQVASSEEASPGADAEPPK